MAGVREEPAALESVGRERELGLLRAAIDALPERCREVLLLRKIKGLSQREIAVALRIPEGTVESLVVEGARRCAEYLQGRGIGPEKNHGAQL